MPRTLMTLKYYVQTGHKHIGTYLTRSLYTEFRSDGLLFNLRRRQASEAMLREVLLAEACFDKHHSKH